MLLEVIYSRGSPLCEYLLMNIWLAFTVGLLCLGLLFLSMSWWIFALVCVWYISRSGVVGIYGS